MDNTYKIITDATSDLDVELVKSDSIEIVPMPVMLGEQEFHHYGDYREMSSSSFYNHLRNGKSASTAQINTYTYMSFLSHTCKRVWILFTYVFLQALVLPFNLHKLP